MSTQTASSGITKSPSELFRILAENDEKKRSTQARPSIELARASLEQEAREHPKSAEEAAEHTGRARTDAAGVLSEEQRTPSAISKDSDDPDVNNIVLENMLGELYVPVTRLSEFQDLAAGGFATVQRAKMQHSNGMSQVVAVKQLLQSRVNSKQDLQDFVAEANLWRKLRSKDVVKLIGIGAKDVSSFSTITSTLYIVCEYMEGGTLREVVERQMLSSKKGVYTFSDVFRWFIGVSRAVKYLHSCSPTIIHRDLKPENVVLTAHDTTVSEAKILDLGLHMRKGSRLVLPGEVEGSFYGGSMYDAAMFNGSVYGSSRAAQSLAEKVKAVEAAGMDMSINVSPPSTNTKHNSTAAGTGLKPIAEEADPEASFRTASPNPVQAAAAATEAAAEEPGANPSDAAPAQPPQDTSADTSSSTDPSRRSSGSGGSRRGNADALAKASLDAVSAKATSGGISSGASGGMRRVGSAGALMGGLRKNTSHQSLASDGTAPASDTVLTTKVGSWLYMAPEMTTGLRYSESVDVFALAVMMFEALSFRLNVMKLAMGGDPEAISEYAEKVAVGHREKIPPRWPQEVKSLLEDAWHQDPKLRINAGEFLKRVSNIIDSGVATWMDENCQPATYNPNADCGCCSVM